jgi:hypothetical protein
MATCGSFPWSARPLPLIRAGRDHSGRKLHFTSVLAAIKEWYGLDTAMATVLTTGGVLACGHVDLEGATFDLHDLALHNHIEHDGSLTHADAAPGAAYAPVAADRTAITRALAHSSDGGASMSLADFARARVDAEGAHPLDAVHARIGRGEVALTLLTMGDGARVSTDRLWAWYGEDRLPDGYVPPPPGSLTVRRVNALVGKVDDAMRARRAELAGADRPGPTDAEEQTDVDQPVGEPVDEPVDEQASSEQL